MKLSRRNALMAAVGSIFGGKDAANSILDTSVLTRGEVGLKGGYTPERIEGVIHGYPAGQIEEYDKQITNLTRIMNGGLEEWQLKYLENTQDLRRRQELFRIDNLKSVSQIYKLSMADRHSKELAKENWRLDAERELKSVLGYKDNFLKSLTGGIFSGTKLKGGSENWNIGNSPKSTRG